MMTTQFKVFQGKHVDLNYLLSLQLLAKNFQIKNNRSKYYLIGSNQSRLYGRGMDFAQVREYQTGDDMRHIDWRVTARTGKPHTKLYQAEKQRMIYIIVDLNASLFFGSENTFKASMAKQIACLYAFAAQQNHDVIRGYAISGNKLIINDQQTPQAALRFANLLANFKQPQAEISARFVKLTDHLVHQKLTAAKLIVISDFQHFDEVTQKRLAQIRLTNEVELVFVYDKLETQAPSPNRYIISNGTEEIAFNTYSQNFCEDFAKRFADKQANLITYCRYNKISWQEISTAQTINDYIKSLKKFLI
ncbi:MAG: DUF58 domain-containing protein [Pseudomonadota bacterium]